MNYYNEFDAKAAAWLRELMRRGLIPNGDVDTRSIAEVSPYELSGYTQCHFFAGIGGWPLSLQIAGWPEDRPVWTGSCPCQPFSNAGKQLAEKDKRHLWPAFRDLIAFGAPAVVFGEQVASRLGRQWLAGVFADLENLGYAAAGADLCAAGVASPHIRQRLFWVADAGKERRERRARAGREAVRGAEYCCRLGDTNGSRSFARELAAKGDRHGRAVVADGGISGLDDAAGARGCGRAGRGEELGRSMPIGDAGAWSDFDLLPCRDGKSRRVESGTFPLAHGVPVRVGRLRGYGNAIVPQVAAEFIRAFRES